MKKLIYIAGAFSAPTYAGERHNVEIARQFAYIAAMNGFTPIVPHLMFGFKDSSESTKFDVSYEDLMEACYRVLATCDICFAIPTWKLSQGARLEVEYAFRENIPIVMNIAEALLLQ